MKRVTSYLVIVMACAYLVGCSSSRKAVKTATDQHIQATQKEDRHTENQTGEAVNVRQTVSDITNAVIEFTKTEYNDGTVNVDTTNRQGAEPTARPHDRESKKPPNGGVKSVTTGRITFNNDHAETTEADIKRDSETKSDESIESDFEEDNATETKSEEKPKHSVWRTLAVCTVLNIVVFCLGCLYWRRKHK